MSYIEGEIMTTKAQNKAVIAPLRQALYDFNADALQVAVKKVFNPQALIQLAHPFETLDGPDGLYAEAFLPLAAAFPDLERRDHIVMSGACGQGGDWVGCCGYYTGTFTKPFLDIPATGHQAALRFHEFYKIQNGQVVEFQALWDLPELMMQAGCWPMLPSLGREWHVPGPATQDGLVITSRDAEHDTASLKLVGDMLDGLSCFAEGGVEAMQLDRYWHPAFSWYGPSGIGTARGVSGFRNWHQIPFLKAMPDRVGSQGAGHFFADGDYVGFTAWPGMSATITGDGWIGIAPAGQKITMRSLDFWRCENGCIRENWVLVDLLHVYHQVGIDVFSRMRELVQVKSLIQ